MLDLKIWLAVKAIVLASTIRRYYLRAEIICHHITCSVSRRIYHQIFVFTEDDDEPTSFHVIEFAVGDLAIVTANTSGLETRFVDPGHTHHSAKNLYVEAPVFYVYLPHYPKSALGCAGVRISRFKMKIGSHVPARCREEEEEQEEKKKPRTIGQRLVEEEALLAASDVHIYHPLLLPGQTSGLTGRVQRPNPPSLPTPGSRRIEIRGSSSVPSLTPRDERA